MGQVSFKLFSLRLLATLFDLLLGALLGLLLANSPAGFFFASRAVVMLRIGSADTIWKGPIPMIMGIMGCFVYVFPLAVLLVLLTEPLFGSSPGKRMLGLRIASCDNALITSKKLWCRSILKTAFFWGIVIALLAGNWLLAVCSVLSGCILLSSMLLSVLFPIRSIHEFLSRTCVIKSRNGS